MLLLTTKTGAANRPAVVLVGHGSLLAASGASMLAIADRLRRQQVVPLVAAGFLNFSQPTFAEAVAKVVAGGASRIIVVPYFLIQGYYVVSELPALVQRVAAAYPHLPFTVTDGLGAHPAMVTLASQRLNAVDPAPDPTTGLLFAAHGTPIAGANTPIQCVLSQVQQRLGYGPARIGYLECNEPSIPAALAELAATGVRRIVVLPYFLHMGRHLRTDLPALFAAAQQTHPAIDLRIAHHLDFDPLLVDALAERMLETVEVG